MEVALFVTPAATSDIVELAEQTMALGSLLRELEGDGLDAVHQAQVPADARPLDAFAMGSLLVTLNPAALPAVITLVQKWLDTGPVPAVRLVLDGDVLELGRVAPPRQRRLVDAFLERHGG